MYIGVHRNFVHNSPKLETTQLLVSCYMDKLIMIYSYNEILLSNKKEWTIARHNNMDKSQKQHAEWKKLDKKKDSILCNFIYIKI